MYYVTKTDAGEVLLYEYAPSDIPHFEIAAIPTIPEAGVGRCAKLCADVDARTLWWELVPEVSSAPWEAKLWEVGEACQNVIYAGIDVGGEHYRLTEHDQIELMAQLSAVQGGAAAVPYHADGKLCRMYPAAEFLQLANAATAHIFYHRTYVNHLNVWIRRTEDAAKLGAIYYGAELPPDLAEHMAELMGVVQG